MPQNLINPNFEALQLLATAYQLNRGNLRRFQERLDRLAEVGRQLKAGQVSAELAIERAEAMGFVAPLAEAAP